jgi:hypothetical protein
VIIMQSGYSRAVRSASYYEMKAEEVRTIADDYIGMAGDRLLLEVKADARL